MAKFSKREKTLTFTIFVLLMVVVGFSAYIWGPDLIAQSTPVDSPPPSPPTMEESIANADVIFSCYYEDTGDYIDCRIDKIFYKDPEYNFTHAVGDFYPRQTYPKGKKQYAGDGAVVIESSKHRVTYHAVSIHNGLIRSFGDISLSDLQRAVDAKYK